MAIAAACSDASTSPAAASPTNDAGVDAADASRCEIPTDAPDWLDTYLADELRKMTAQPDRASAEHRRVAREGLRDELVALGLEASVVEYGDGANVVARLPPTAGDAVEWVLVGAHYDSVAGSAGANDNASGTTAVLAVARMARDLRCRERGLIVAFFDEEELGLFGSQALATAEAKAGTNIVAVHTVDQVGWDADGDRRFEIELPTTELFAAYQASAEVLGVSVVKTNVDGSDHQSFREKGFPAVGITEEYVNRDTSPHRHTQTDVASTVDAEYHRLAARLVGAVVLNQLHPPPP